MCRLAVQSNSVVSSLLSQLLRVDSRVARVAGEQCLHAQGFFTLAFSSMFLSELIASRARVSEQQCGMKNVVATLQRIQSEP